MNKAISFFNDNINVALQKKSNRSNSGTNGLKLWRIKLLLLLLLTLFSFSLMSDTHTHCVCK